ncbi:aminoglycoside phosphotransferase family protein [Sphaerospermopsis sp. LEGE 08334]|jgi:thiamine kinase-like enzyme|uniref:aminoglycoside phosphotransferase family protein n=1 Tax=Sphaerospermopsis sp. LEGE 08334 TaxID=1828651 RepID=UPI00187ED5A0|nr:aminoglycoside phosphotransferase family protein [Sphaerospermopsis sp. LEGE 08334]MBE9054490.1 aminoglycoside phosphotransferase family protein [Sphaerospermopsis sp. LEGE 08334]
MILSLSSQNVIQYLQKAGLCSSEDGALYESDLPGSGGNNRNLLVKLADNRKLLVKQERCRNFDSSPHEFFNEWLFHQLLDKFPVLGNISAIASLLLHFDAENSILVRSYLSEYMELGKFYENNSIFPIEIATAIGNTLAALHRSTFQKREYRDFMDTAPQGQFRYHYYNPAQGIGSINQDIFGNIPTEALKFHTLYQKYESLESAIADLAYEWKPCCLTHNDLQLNNILVHSRWQNLDNCLVRLIDWEACAWGDPAFDLGNLLASYVKIWLSSLVVDPSLNLEESLNLAIIPLEVIQPSILAVIHAYLHAFPMILDYRRDFILRVIQFTGLALTHQIQNMIEYEKYFDNTHLCMLEVAKSLLIMPEQAVLTIFGSSEAEILQSVTGLNTKAKPEKEKQLLRIYYEKTRLRGC